MNEENKKLIEDFVIERDWDQFHTPENLAKSIVIEAAELLQLFQWGSDNSVERVREEIADVIIYTQLFLNKMKLDINEIVREKIHNNEMKYPVNLSKGSSKKYTEFEV
ncbi:MAG TPA: nucleotide pyrophosphohydrolase [Clostridiaceae bacterium]|nr:nucleotide pyrophosphohydrolase [Clostridiaceae bacterium]